MADSNGTETETAVDDDRRRLLGYAGLATLLASGGAGAWALSRQPAPDDEGSSGTGTPTPDGTTQSGENQADEVPAVVGRYAPDLYFGALEKWFPTDPRQYVVDIVLQDVRDRLASESQGGYDDSAVAVLDPRVAAAIERTNAAIDADL